MTLLVPALGLWPKKHIPISALVFHIFCHFVTCAHSACRLIILYFYFIKYYVGPKFFLFATYDSTHTVFLILNFALIFPLQLIDISDDGFLSLMMESGEIRDDIKVPEGDLGTEIRNKFENSEDLLVSKNNNWCFSR